MVSRWTPVVPFAATISEEHSMPEDAASRVNTHAVTDRRGLSTISFFASMKFHGHMASGNLVRHRERSGFERTAGAFFEAVGNLVVCAHKELFYFQQRLSSFLHSPRYKSRSWAYMCFLQLVICIGVVNALSDSQISEVEGRGGSSWPGFFAVEVLVNAVFLFDLLLRLLAAYEPRRFLMHPATWIDVISLIPFFVAVGVRDWGHFSVPLVYIIQVLRLTRLLKIFRFSQGMLAVFALTFKRIAPLFNNLLMYMLIVLGFTASFVWYLECGEIDPVVRLELSLALHKKRWALSITCQHLPSFDSIHIF